MSAVGPKSTSMTCPNCHLEMMTRIVQKATIRTHLIALIMCLTLLWPCAICLYCTDCACRVYHYCPSCNAFVGSYDQCSRFIS